MERHEEVACEGAVDSVAEGEVLLREAHNELEEVPGEVSIVLASFTGPPSTPPGAPPLAPPSSFARLPTVPYGVTSDTG